MGFEPCKRAIARIAKEGRKYGASLCIITQRPAEIDPTILSQCNTVFALRMSNDRDQAIVSSAISDSGSGLLEFLSALGQREAIAFGDGVTLPVRIRFDELPQHAMPRSSTARFSEMWQRSAETKCFLDQIVEKWRLSASGGGTEIAQQAALFAEALDAPGSVTEVSSEDDAPAQRQLADFVATADTEEPHYVQDPLLTARTPMPAASGGRSPRWETIPPRRDVPTPASNPSQAQPGGALRSLRERLSQRTPTR